MRKFFCKLVPLALILHNFHFFQAHAAEPFNEKTAAALDQILAEKTLFSGEPGSAMTVSQGDQIWRGASGVANLQNKTPMLTDSQFRAGSHGKMLIATMAMQLIEEGSLTLESKVSEFLPEYTHWKNITVHQLMAMTSGIPDFLTSPTLIARLTIYPKQEFTPDYLLQYVHNSPLRFVPGTSCQYSQSNTFLLALIIEKITGDTLDEALQKRIAGPLNLSQTFFDMKGEELNNLANGYSAVTLAARTAGLPTFLSYLFSAESRLDHGIVDTTYLVHPSLTWAAGGLISSPKDMAKFLRALWHSELISKDSLAVMMETRPCDVLGVATINYGTGIIMDKTDYGPAYGHDGLNIGYDSRSYYFPKLDLAYSQMTNILPTQSKEIIQEIVQTVVKGPVDHLKTCNPSEEYLNRDEEGVLTLRFRGKIQNAKRSQAISGLGFFTSLIQGQEQEYFGLGMKAERQRHGVLITATGPSYSYWYKNRQAQVYFPDNFKNSLDPQNPETFALDKSGAWVVIRDAVKHPTHAELMRSCVSAVASPAKPSGLLFCDAKNVSSKTGSLLKVFGRISLEQNPNEITEYLNRFKIARCVCYDKAMKSVACPE